MADEYRRHYPASTFFAERRIETGVPIAVGVIAHGRNYLEVPPGCLTIR